MFQIIDTNYNYFSSASNNKYMFTYKPYITVVLNTYLNYNYKIFVFLVTTPNGKYIESVCSVIFESFKIFIATIIQNIIYDVNYSVFLSTVLTVLTYR